MMGYGMETGVIYGDTGPFCRHWSDPSDCDEICVNCGHGCTQHDIESGECMECDCTEWLED